MLEALFLTAFVGAPAALLLAALVATRERDIAQTTPRCQCRQKSAGTS